MKTCNNEHTKWVGMALLVFWVDCVTIRQSISYSPFFMAHGIEAVLPLDIEEATYLLPPLMLPHQQRTLLHIVPSSFKNARKISLRCQQGS